MCRFFLILHCIIAACWASSIPIEKEINQEPDPDFSFFTSALPVRVRTAEELVKSNESTILDFVGLVQQYKGYTAEEYNVTTEDEYILVLHRITGSPSSPKADNKPVVFLQHGILASSDTWVVLGPNNSLALQLADEGYDVFLGNLRGNSYSRYHVTYSITNNSKQFWDFGLDEMAVYDMPAMLDFVLTKSTQKDLTYIGHSMGTALSYMLLSENPEYNKKINLLISLSPIAYFNHQHYSIVHAFAQPILLAAHISKSFEVLPLSIKTIQYTKKKCHGLEENLCKKLFRKVMDINHVNFTNLQQVLTHFPAGASLRTLEHFDQIISSGKFQMYDYGCHDNFWDLLVCRNRYYYNQDSPPEYNVTMVTAPTVIFYAENDKLVKVEDAKYLIGKLGNVVSFVKVPGANFNHLDFLWSTLTKSYINDPIVKLIKSKTTQKTKS